MEQEKFSSQCDMTKITKNSLLRALSIDGPIGVGVVCFKDPNVPKIGAYLLTSVAAFFSYFARSTAKECIANLTNEETYYVKAISPYVGAVIGGTTYHSLIDGISLKSLYEGSTRQLMYEFNADFNPLANTTIGNIASFIAIESIQYGVIEGDSLLTGVLIGSYAGFAFEYLVDTADDYIYTPAYNYFFS